MNKHKNISLGGGKLEILGLSLLISISPVLSVLAETKLASCEAGCQSQFDKAVQRSLVIQSDDHKFAGKTEEASRSRCKSDRTNRDTKSYNNCEAEKGKNNNNFKQTVANLGYNYDVQSINLTNYHTGANTATNKLTTDNLNADEEFRRLKVNSLEDYRDCAEKARIAKDQEINAADRKQLADVRKAEDAQDDCLEKCKVS
jgi:hypothetical protein